MSLGLTCFEDNTALVSMFGVEEDACTYVSAFIAKFNLRNVDDIVFTENLMSYNSCKQNKVILSRMLLLVQRASEKEFRVLNW